jgi:hypothetical protein
LQLNFGTTSTSLKPLERTTLTLLADAFGGFAEFDFGRMNDGVSLVSLKPLFQRAHFEEVHAAEGPATRFRHAAQFFPRFGQR